MSTSALKFKFTSKVDHDRLAFLRFSGTAASDGLCYDDGLHLEWIAKHAELMDVFDLATAHSNGVRVHRELASGSIGIVVVVAKCPAHAHHDDGSRSQRHQQRGRR